MGRCVPTLYFMTIVVGWWREESRRSADFSLKNGVLAECMIEKVPSGELFYL